MLFDHTVPKPPTVGAYANHQLLEGLTGGDRPLFVDMGDHLIVRSASPITDRFRTVPEVAKDEVRAFELRASCGVKTKGRHRYFPVGDWRARHDWLQRRARSYGFEVLTVNVTAQRMRIDRAERSFWIDSSDFTGVLRVIDEGAFRKVLAEGFPGPGRAFGHGMLLI
jgi:CRISPR-associated protein Cas6/Cse3/CasE subtype I-E